MAEVDLGKVKQTDDDVKTIFWSMVTIATEDPETVGENEIVLVVET